MPAPTFHHAITSAPEALPPAPPLSRDSDVVVVLAALLCAVICVVGVALIARCVWLRRNHPTTYATTVTTVLPPTSHSPNKGIKRSVLVSIPTISYQGAAAETSPECVICLAEFARGDEIRVLPQCGHRYHAACVDVWLRSHSSCPSCRRILVMTAAGCQRCAAAGMPEETAAVTVMVEEEEKAFGYMIRSADTFLP